MPKSVTSRGFVNYDEFTDHYGGKVTIRESSLASEPAVWIFADSRAYSDAKTTAPGEGAAHLTVEMAKRVRDALQEFINEYEGTPCKVCGASTHQ